MIIVGIIKESFRIGLVKSWVRKSWFRGCCKGSIKYEFFIEVLFIGFLSERKICVFFYIGIFLRVCFVLV